MKNSSPIKEPGKFSFQENMDFLNTENPSMPLLPENYRILTREDAASVCFYRIKQLSFAEDYPHREAFANVLMALDTKAFNFVYILTGNEYGVTIDIGVVRNEEENKAVFGKKLNARDYGENLENIFKGNFGGSLLERLKGEKLWETLLTCRNDYKNAGLIIGIPSVSDAQTGKGEYGFQGIDRLINSMAGKRWRLVLVCKRVPEQEIRSLFKRICDYYDEIAPYARQTAQIGLNHGVTESESENEGHSHGDTYSHSKTQGKSSGSSSGTSSSSRNSGTSFSDGEQYGSSEGYSSGSGKSRGSSKSVSQSLTLERQQKDVQEKLDYIDNELMERLRSALSRGLFSTAVYYMGGTQAEANRLRVGLLSLFQGGSSSFSPLKSIPLEMQGAGLETLFSYQCCSALMPDFIPNPAACLALASCPYNEEHDLMGLSTYLTADEVSLMAGLPQREVPGIAVRESVEFGLNYKMPQSDSITLGHLVQKGRELVHLPVKLGKDVLKKHIFVAGVTGSGKTTTCHKLLKEAGLPFLVIEPAKTEYRALLQTDDPALQDLHIFTAGNENVAPLRLNPFEVINRESLTAHIDMLKAAFVSAFPMEASMPQIMEEAIYKCYEDKGWDIFSDVNLQTEEDGNGSAKTLPEFPILEDFLAVLEAVVESKGFDARLRDDYRGSLISRFSNLTKGSKGALLNCRRSTNFEELIGKNVVIEMENLKSAEDKALLMGFILARLSALIQKKHRENPAFQHITLIEEAHRLLARPDYGDSGARRAAVESFTDMLAEVRKYGEGLIIVDQIPNKLAPEVLKNTNTKIIHRLFARDDKEAVGDTMLMDKKQQEYLSALETGQAIVFSEDMNRPLNVKIIAETDTSGIDLEDSVLRRLYERRFAMEFETGKRERKKQRILRRLLPSLLALMRKLNSADWKLEQAPPELALAWENWRKEAEEEIAANPELTADEIWTCLAADLAKTMKPPFPGQEFVEAAGEIVKAILDGAWSEFKNNRKLTLLFNKYVRK